MRFKNMPAIITLTAGLIASVIMIFNRVSLLRFLVSLFVVMLCFAIAGTFIRYVMVKLLEVTKTKEEPKSEQGDEEENKKTEEKAE